MKKKTSKKKAKRDVVYHVSQKEYDRDIRRGIPPNETLRPGRHVAQRGGFLKRHGVTPDQVQRAIDESREAKQLVSIRLDSDILAFFRERAEDPLAAGYQTQINAVLRKYMEREKGSA
jgi:uncharacterized protein (DUF4415 family)